MNRQEFEQMMISNLVDGDSYEITRYIDPKYLEEELAELIFTWSTFQTDPQRLQEAMKRHLVGLVNRVIKQQNLPEYEPTEEDKYYEFQEYLYEERKDRGMYES
jgi:hypothetical protein